MTQPPAEQPGMPSRRVIDQRVRNRVIECLELASSFERQLEYERRAPIPSVPNEIINQWEDWVYQDPREDLDLSQVYDSAEAEAMGQFHDAWDAADSALPGDYPQLAQVQVLPEWEQLRDAASAALSVFMRRGKLPEDYEVEN